MNRTYVYLDEPRAELIEAPGTRYDFDPRDAETVDLLDKESDLVATFNITSCERESGSDLIVVYVEPVEDRKDTNPKDGIGLAKSALSVVPLPGIMEGALAMMEGALKYGRHNYREAGIRYSVYFDAIIRHMFAWFEGEDRAPDSGVHHLGHVLAGCAILLDDILSENPKGNDDRPPVTHSPEWLPEFNRRVVELKARYPKPVPPHTER